MIDKYTPHRPGLTAIAAVLALSSTSAIAQVALPADPAPPPSAVLAAPPAAAPVQAPVQTVQAVPATPALPDIPVSDAAPRTASTRTVAVPVAPKAAPRRTAPHAPPVHEAQVAPTASKVPPSTAMAAPAERHHVTPIVPIKAAPAPARPATAPVASAQRNGADDTNYAGWALIGGGALLVAGGAAFALSRRPKRRDEDVAYASYDRPVAIDEADAVAIHPAPLPAEPVSVSRQPIHDAVPARTMAFDKDYADMDVGERHAALETLVAEPPTEANPFTTRHNRVRRADFLLRTGQAAPRDGEYLVTERDPEVASARTDRWSEMRLFGKQKTPINWRPARG